jgi:hypothetical protein
MLAHPPFVGLPLVIEYIHCGVDNAIPMKYKQEITQALRHRDRVRRIRLHAPYSETVLGALDGDFPILESLYLRFPNAPYSTWEPPRTFRTPSLRQVVLKNVTCSLQSPLLAPTAGLVSLSLTDIGELERFSPNNLLQQLSLMHRLETLRIGFALYSSSPALDPAVETQVIRQPIRTRVQLPYLRQFLFNGTSAYLETLLPHISTPPLEKLQIYISNWQTRSIPDSLKLMNRSENFRCHSVELIFLDKGVFVRAILTEGTRLMAFYVSFHGSDFTWQVLCAAHFFYMHRTCFYTTKYLNINYRKPASKQQGVGPDRTQLRKLFVVFCNLNTLLVHDGPHGDISRSFQMNHGESGMNLLPSLKQLSVDKYRDTCATFVNARVRAGCPVKVCIRKAPLAASVAINCQAWEAPWLWGSFRLRLG